MQQAMVGVSMGIQLQRLALPSRRRAAAQLRASVESSAIAKMDASVVKQILKGKALTSVLLSSIFFIADSVVSGYLTIANGSNRSAGGLLQDDNGNSDVPAQHMP